MNTTKADARRKKIQKMVQEGHTCKETGAKFKITGERVRQLIKKAEWLEEHPGIGMDRRLYNLMARVLKINSPSLMDIQNYIEQNPDWRKKLLRANGFGPIRLKELETFCRENGISVDAPGSAGKTS